MSPRHGRKPPAISDAARHQERVERARYTLPIEVVTVEDDTDEWDDVVEQVRSSPTGPYIDYITEDPEQNFLDWGDPEGSR